MKPPRPNHAAHVHHEVQSLVVPNGEEELTLAGFWEKLEYSPEDFKDYHLNDHWHPEEDVRYYMNEISKIILKSFRGLDQDRPILFHTASEIPPLDHPTGTMCKPDFVACPKTKGNIHWTEIEATVEIHSAGENATGEPRHAGTYTLYLLKARPDRVSVQDVKGVVLIISSADGVKKSLKLDLKDAEQSQLIYVFVKRLYDLLPSMIDPTVERPKDIIRRQNSLWDFDIMLTIPISPSVECVGYRIEKALGSVVRRTHIFVNNDNSRLLNGVAITVIKDQYCYRGHRFNEAEVLGHFHVKDEIPRVVHLAHYPKKRTHLVEYGAPFMDLKTPLEALKVIYDLLETTRFLYFKRKILHRDISSGNLLCMETDLPTASALTKNTSQEHNFCFIEHLLDPNVAPRAAVNSLVDFDLGEIRYMRKGKTRRLERTDSPTFMARAVRAGRPLGKVRRLAQYKKVPELSQKAYVYEDVFPDRLRRFQHSPGSPDYHFVRIGAPPDSSSLLHELRHDAESAFWLLVWWVVNAAPDDCTSEIPTQLWVPLVGTNGDTRYLDIPSSFLDPAYAPLSELLQHLGEALEHDLHWATDTPYTYPDFLHEVFQRHILNFISENRDKDFMKLAKADASRQFDTCIQLPPYI